MGGFDINLGKNNGRIDLSAINGGIKEDDTIANVDEEYKSIFDALDKDGQTKGVLENSEVASLIGKIKMAMGKNRTLSKHEAKKVLADIGLKCKVKVETFFNFLRDILDISARIVDAETNEETGQTKITYKDKTVQVIDANGQLKETKGVDEEGEYTRTELGDGRYNIDRGKAEDTKLYGLGNPFDVENTHVTKNLHYKIQYSKSGYYHKIYDNGSYITYDLHDRPVGGKYMTYTYDEEGNKIEDGLEEYSVEYDNDTDKSGTAVVGSRKYVLDAKGRVIQEYGLNVENKEVLYSDYKYYPNGTIQKTRYDAGDGIVTNKSYYHQNAYGEIKYDMGMWAEKSDRGTLYTDEYRNKSYSEDSDGNIYTHAKSGETIQDTVRRIFGYVSEYEAFGITDDDINEFIQVNRDMGNIPKGKNYFLLTTDEDKGRVFIPKKLANKLHVLHQKNLLVDTEDEWNKHNS